MGVMPTCPNTHTLSRRVADGEYECDLCSADLPSGSCFFGCVPCDYSLCGGCYVKLATGTLEVPQDGTAPGGGLEPAGQAEGDSSVRIDPDVADLCDYYQIEDRIMLKLNEAMKGRKDTFVGDMEKLWKELETARSPPGLLMAMIRQMNEGKFVGKVPPSKEVQRLIEKYRLDEDARTKLADFIFKRPDTAKQDLFEIERRLDTSGRPSATVMTMIVKLQRGERLPALQQAAPHRDYGELDKVRPGTLKATTTQGSSSRKDQDREKDRGDRDRRRSRSRDRRRSRSRGH